MTEATLQTSLKVPDEGDRRGRPYEQYTLECAHRKPVGVQCGSRFYTHWLEDSRRFRLAEHAAGWVVAAEEWQGCHDAHVLATREDGPVDFVPTTDGELKLEAGQVYEITRVDGCEEFKIEALIP